MALVGGSLAVAAIGVAGLSLLTRPPSAGFDIANRSIPSVGMANDDGEGVSGDLASTATTEQADLNSSSQGDGDQSNTGDQALGASTTTTVAFAPDLSGGGGAEPSPGHQPGDNGSGDRSPKAAGPSVGDQGLGVGGTGDGSSDEVESNGQADTGDAGDNTIAGGGDLATDAADIDIGRRASFPAVYGSTELAAPLASFMVTERYILTSAWALGGRDEVFIRLNDDWISASVVVSDLDTDIAILEMAEGVDLSLPSLDPAPESAATGGSAVAGYCVDPLVSETCASAFLEWWEAKNPKPSSTLQADWARTGQVLNRVSSVTIRNGYTVYDQIKTGIMSAPHLAGGPLLNDEGQAIGMVIAADWVHVVATPIDRAIAIADGLLSDEATTPWVGVSVRERARGMGVKVVSVDPDGPAFGLLAPDDTITAIDGYDVTGVGHFNDLVRRAEVGSEIALDRRRVVRDFDGSTARADATVVVTVGQAER